MRPQKRDSLPGALGIGGLADARRCFLQQSKAIAAGDSEPEAEPLWAGPAE